MNGSTQKDIKTKKNIGEIISKIMLALMVVVPWVVVFDFAAEWLVGAAALLLVIQKVIAKILFFRRMKLWNADKENIDRLGKFSGNDIVKLFAIKEINSMCDEKEKIIFKKVSVLRLIVAGVMSVFLFVMFSFFYVGYFYSSIAAATLLLFMMFVFMSFDKFYFIRKKAAKNPELPLDKVIESQLADETESAKYKLCKLLSVLVIPLTLIVVVVLNAESEMTIEKTQAGYAVTHYRQGLFDRETRLEIPAEFEGNPVVAIGKKAFANNYKIEEIVIPDSVLYIDKSAFLNCQELSKVQMSSNVTRIDSFAFKNCSSLEQISLPDSIKEIGGEAFYGCSSLKSIVIPKSVTEIRGHCFYGCSSLESVELHDGIIDIHANAFESCSSLKAIDLPSKITEIHAYTFEGCKSLEQIDIPVGVTRIAAHAFYGCDSLFEVNVPDTLKEIGSSAFRKCEKLKQIYLPEGVKVNEKAFKESPTKQLKKPVSDDILLKVNEEIEAMKIKEVYVVVHDGTGEYVTENTADAIVVLTSDKLFYLLTEEFTVNKFESPSDFIEFLNGAKAKGYEKIQMCYYSEVAVESTGEQVYMNQFFDIDDLIDLYKKNPTEF